MNSLGKVTNKAAFFTVVYPGVEKYLPDFFRSLENQSCPAFDLIVANDGLQDLDLNGYHLNSQIIDLTGSPVEIRAMGLQLIKSMGYEHIIFGDSDDFFSTNRVESSLWQLRECDIVVNDLDLVNERGELLLSGYFSQRLGKTKHIEANFIRDKNIFGLSNTSVRSACLPEEKYPAGLVAMDWFLFAKVLESGANAVFSSECSTYYRQHGANIAGFAETSPQKTLQSVKVKALHYAALASEGMPFYQNPAVEFELLHQRLLQDVAFRGKYFAFLQSTIADFPFWWEDAPLPEE